LAVVAVFVFAQVIQARPVQQFSLEELSQEADLVVALAPVSTCRTEDQLTSAGPRYGPRDPKHYQGFNTQFKILLVLKKSAPLASFTNRSLTLLHFAFKAGPMELNGGRFVYFHLPPNRYIVVADASEISPPTLPANWPVAMGFPSVLAFLRQRADGRFEPVTGNYDAAPSFMALAEMFNGQPYFAKDHLFEAPAQPVK